jgi:Ca2+-binding EF-hand superfamily protein
LWVKQTELEMIERNPEPRPNTHQEKVLMRKRLARDRKKRLQAQNMAQAKWQISGLGGSTEVMDKEELSFFFEQLDVDGSGKLDLLEVAELMQKLGMDLSNQPAPVVGRLFSELDRDGDGTVDVEELTVWWKRSGKEMQAKLTELNDKMRLVNELFDDIDIDGSGKIERDEIAILVSSLGFQMSEIEVTCAMDAMDADRSGEVDFQEFWRCVPQAAQRTQMPD